MVARRDFLFFSFDLRHYGLRSNSIDALPGVTYASPKFSRLHRRDPSLPTKYFLTVRGTAVVLRKKNIHEMYMGGGHF